MRELRCRPGDLARVIYSKLDGLVGRTVFVEGVGASPPDGSHLWNVTLFGAPVVGVGPLSGRPRVTHKLRFSDSSLLPLRGDPPADEGLAGHIRSASFAG
ncbi:hypothetical protein [Burkholderia sp. ABCPW 11]|uniref:hypothetical protein n=1 Tax=Burkholderia sp. ABCPW 11 TaxID=1637859 RepID=UPI000ABB11C1|nr:hypothetical protein [Burkholderia sp. ABCPW 11]